MPANGTRTPFARNLVVDDPQVARWLCAVGFIEEDHGNWTLTELGEAAVARFYGDTVHFRSSPPANPASRSQ